MFDKRQKYALKGLYHLSGGSAAVAGTKLAARTVKRFGPKIWSGLTSRAKLKVMAHAAVAKSKARRKGGRWLLKKVHAAKAGSYSEKMWFKAYNRFYE